jgi:hypothetical protein
VKHIDALAHVPWKCFPAPPYRCEALCSSDVALHTAQKEKSGLMLA